MDTVLVATGNKLWDSVVVYSYGWRGLELVDHSIPCKCDKEALAQ